MSSSRSSQVGCLLCAIFALSLYTETTSAAFENCRPGEQFVRSPVTGYQFTAENCAKAQRWCQNECQKAGQTIVFGECSGQHLRGTLMEACCGSPPPPCPEPPIDEGDMTSSLTAPQ